jgi:hypothetical protein
MLKIMLQWVLMLKLLQPVEAALDDQREQYFAV